MDHSREIRQLWFIAKHYFKNAEKLGVKYYEYLETTLGDIMGFYEKEIPKQKYELGLSLLVAHLNSAAVRLYTINERFKEDHKTKIFGYYQDDLLQNRKIMPDEEHWNARDLAEELIRHKKEYLPLMLRDEVGHLEEGKSKRKNEDKEVIWKARHIAIESLKVIEVFTCMQSAIAVVETELKKYKPHSYK